MSYRHDVALIAPNAEAVGPVYVFGGICYLFALLTRL